MKDFNEISHEDHLRVHADALAIMSTAHPRAPWWKRLWMRIRQPDLNEGSLEEVVIELPPNVPEHGWTCFHCWEHFPPTYKGQRDARLHFGDTPIDKPACLISAGQIRAMEDLLHRYQEEDTDLHRRLSRAHIERDQAVRRAEELGYARGLRDQHKGTLAFVFMHQRPTDKQAWPVLYQNREVAENCKFRVSELREIHVPDVEERLLAKMVAEYLAAP